MPMTLLPLQIAPPDPRLPAWPLVGLPVRLATDRPAKLPMIPADVSTSPGKLVAVPLAPIPTVNGVRCMIMKIGVEPFGGTTRTNGPRPSAMVCGDGAVGLEPAIIPMLKKPFCDRRNGG